ncbi:MAG: peroxiredoxin [Cyclobacteriaceae bacterium]|nr:peroxiredoxin [Cyclobacteriaceae bacterium]
MSLVAKKAPLFTAPAVINGNEIVEDFSLESLIGKQEIVLFFYPKDFTFVCPTEILSFQELLPEFEKRNVAVIGVSTDTEETHLAWLYTPKKQGGIQGVTYPLVADTSKTIASNYGVLGGDWDYDDNGNLVFDGEPIAFRGTFLIDKEGIVRHEYINYLPLGRNIKDTLRIVDAWQFTEEHGEVCPANWEEGKDTMKETRDSVAEYLSTH